MNYTSTPPDSGYTDNLTGAGSAGTGSAETGCDCSCHTTGQSVYDLFEDMRLQFQQANGEAYGLYVTGRRLARMARTTKRVSDRILQQATEAQKAAYTLKTFINRLEGTFNNLKDEL